MPSLSTDQPLSDPRSDLFGHAPFAQHLANAIAVHDGAEGIVIALYGPWGSGKSTVLGYVVHYLNKLPAPQRPVVVTFNPWWFSGQENLAKAFLGQLQAVLPEKFAAFKKVAEKLSEFSDALGGVAEVGGSLLGIPVPGSIVKASAKWLAPKPKDVPALKAALSHLLLNEQQRILVLIDDIDRLTPEEVRQLFTVIKALADFPYVTYLLAFDREVASKAITAETGLPGERYLEKIIQVPFELPVVDRIAIRKALFATLDTVMKTTPAARFDNAHWTNIFYSGIDPLVRVPRDIVRLGNSLSVTYPSVAGEVNPVDFIAIEALRVFLPNVYEVIRTNQDKFAGHDVPDNDTKPAHVKFHQAWLKDVPETLQSPIKDMLERLFPKLEAVWSNMHYGPESAMAWRRDLRVCSPNIFSTYFRLSLPSGALSRSELDKALASGGDAAAMANTLMEASKEKRADGLSKARELLERLMDHVETDIPSDHIPSIVQALLNVGDELLIESDSRPFSFEFGNETRVSRLVYHLTKRLQNPERGPLLVSSLEAGSALRCSQYLIAALEKEVGKNDALVDKTVVDHLKQIWIDKVRQAANAGTLLGHVELAGVLSGWRTWGKADEVKSWWDKVAASDEGLIALVSKFKTESTSNVMGDYAVKVQLRVNPKAIEHYGDVQAISQRLQTLIAGGNVPLEARPAIDQFILECTLLAQGKEFEAD